MQNSKYDKNKFNLFQSSQHEKSYKTLVRN